MDFKVPRKWLLVCIILIKIAGSILAEIFLMEFNSGNKNVGICYWFPFVSPSTSRGVPEG